ncbi:MAG: glycosyltransferase family 4 protein [Ignavibacteria bacterium]
MSKSIGVSFISSYVPRQCGIATFTNDLANAINNENTDEQSINITALNDIADGYKYSSEVKFEIKDKNARDFKEAAYYLNLSGVDVINIQHEFGLYGGEAGANILFLMEKLNKPVVTTLHTVLENPSKEEAKVLKEIARRSSFLVVQSERSYRMLQSVAKVPTEKIRFVPHGAHDVPFMDPAFYKDKFNLSEKKVMLTFGLLGPGKGLEDVINALPKVIEKNSDVMYVILGATHPNVKRQLGESYRNSLENMVKKMGLENHVMFINRFVSTEELLEFLLMSDIYVSPYRNKEQAVSGTLTYALACGKAIVSTPYWYAEELLADEKGILVPFNDPEKMGEALSILVNDENLRNRLRKNAYDAGREMIWSSVGKKYIEIFQQAAEEFKSTAILPVPSTLNNVLPSLPDINLIHLKNLTDSTGIFQHATYSIPNRDEGYCTDDNVRALLVAIMHKMNFNDENIDWYINKYMTFVYHSFNREKGLFRNFMSYERKWLDEVGSEDSNGRVMFVLGYLVKNTQSLSILGLVKNLFDQSIKNMFHFKSPRAVAYIIIGCIFYLNKFSGAREIKKILKGLSARLTELYINSRTDDWRWYENRVTYVNARLPQALLMAGQYLNNKELTATGLESLEWLYKNLYDEDGKYLSLIGNDGWYNKDGVKAKYDQQPVEIPALIDACYQAYLITQDDKWIKNIGTSFSWFLGNNDRQELLVDFMSGGCYDGLTIKNVNENQGAESTLSWLMSLHRMVIISHQLQINSEITIDNNEESKEKFFQEYV